MNKQTFKLMNADIVNNCIAMITKWWQRQHDAGKTLIVEIKRLNRSLEENRRYWAILVWRYAVPFDPRTGNPLTAADVGL